MKSVLALPLLAAGLTLAPLAASAAPGDVFLTHQGRLLTSDDAPVTSQTTLTVKLYKSFDGGEGDVVWSETYSVLPMNGTYSILLGDTRNQKRALKAADVVGDRWLTVTVGGIELQPRLRIGTVPSAANALQLGGVAAELYALKTDTAPDSLKLGGTEAASYALKTDTVANALKLGGTDAASFALKTDTAPNALKLGGADAASYALKTDTVANALKLGGTDAASFALKTDTAPDSLKLGGVAAAQYALKSDTAPNSMLFGGDPPSAFVKTAGSGNLTLSGTATLGSVALTPSTSGLPTCNSASAGRMQFDAASKDFLACDGTTWVSLLGRLVGRSAANPGTSCLDIKQKAPQSSDGIYWIDTDGFGSGDAPFQVVCDMTRDGGGWTLALKTWYQSGLAGQTKAVNSQYVYDALSRKESGRPYKLSDQQIRSIIGTDKNFDALVDEHGFNPAYSTGNYEYVVLRNYTADFTFGALMSESSTPTTLQSYRASDNALAWTGRLACGTPTSASGVNGSAFGINCYNIVSGPVPGGGSGCNINMGSSTNPGWHNLYMSESNTDTYIYICNGAQHSSSYDLVHRWWIR